MLISDMVSMLAISRLMPTVTGPSEKNNNTHCIHYRVTTLLTEEDSRKGLLIYMRYKSGLHQLKPGAFSAELNLVLIAVVDDDKTLREDKIHLCNIIVCVNVKALFVVLSKNGLRYLLYPFISF